MPGNQSRPESDDDPFEACPMAQAFEEIGSKWRLIVLHYLLNAGEQRFSEIQESTPADSATLSRVLTELEERNLVSRRLEDKPISTYYQLTDKGESLATLFADIEDWAGEWTAGDKEGVDALP